jgi:hypothetical protein
MRRIVEKVGPCRVGSKVIRESSTPQVLEKQKKSHDIHSVLYLSFKRSNDPRC